MNKTTLQNPSIKVKQEITQKLLKELLSYDPETGTFRWNVANSNRIHAFDIAGCVYNTGYRVISMLGKQYLASRLAFLYMDGYLPEHDVDHVNRIRDDNRWVNLRHVSRMCNMRNRPVPAHNKSGISGISWDNPNGKWRVYIGVNGRTIHVGRFHDFDDAVIARLKAEKKHGFPECDLESSAYSYLKKCRV